MACYSAKAKAMSVPRVTEHVDAYYPFCENSPMHDVFTRFENDFCISSSKRATEVLDQLQEGIRSFTDEHSEPRSFSTENRYSDDGGTTVRIMEQLMLLNSSEARRDAVASVAQAASSDSRSHQHSSTSTVHEIADTLKQELVEIR